MATPIHLELLTDFFNKIDPQPTLGGFVLRTRSRFLWVLTEPDPPAARDSLWDAIADVLGALSPTTLQTISPCRLCFVLAGKCSSSD